MARRHTRYESVETFIENHVKKALFDTGNTDVYRAYLEWCSTAGVRVASHRALTRALKSHGYQQIQSGRKIWVGMGVST